MERKLCECGCGQEVKNRFVRGHHMKGIPKSKEHREKIGNIHRGKTVSSTTREKLSKAAKDRECSETTREKISKALKGKKKGPFSEAHKKALSEAHMGYVVPVEVLIKRSNTIAENRTPKEDDYCDAWSDKEYVDGLRKTACERCGITNHMNFKLVGYRLSTHHIDEDKQNCHPENIKTLCTSCHAKVHSETRPKEINEKISKTLKGRKGRIPSEETKQKIGRTLRNKNKT